MKMLPLWLLALAAWGTEVSEIAQRIETLSQELLLQPRPDYRVYDPFARSKPLLQQKSAPVVTATPKALRVETVLAGRAWVEGRWVGKGDALAGGTVVSVSPHGIVIAYAHEQIAVARVKAAAISMTKDPIE
ncbi:MAG: hypothetical protein JXK05_06690 [Campylobacterales bacterium]|nr:hypothetical protein [Campylobacterales bacterium]